MTREELQQLITEVQQSQCELADIEVKSAHGGTPQRLYEPLSAFANRTEGGVILFGLDESRNFEIVGVGNAHRLQEEISHLAWTDMEPQIHPEFTVELFDGKTVVALEVSPVPADKRPCHYKTAGLQKGSYIRVGNTNRSMTDYEIFGYVSAQSQPTFDEEPIKEAALEDLDKEKLNFFLERIRKNRPKAAYLKQPFEQVLTHLRVARPYEGKLHPTLAGLLTFGYHPQTLESQLVITFLHYFGTTETEKTPRGERFLDNRKFEGPIPEMVEDAVNHVMASIRKGSLIEGLYRRDIPEYPEEAIREAIVNAVAHRDYSTFARGSYVQIRLFADRMEIQSPGGLYGTVTLETLEEEQSTRNRTLVRLLEDLHLVENRGSGIKAMLGAMRSANLEPPRFQDKRSSFLVTMRNLTLMNTEAITWLNGFAEWPLNDRQRLALVYLRHNHQITNFDYQRLTHVDSVTASRELRGLVQTGLTSQHSSRRWTHYMLNVPTTDKVEVSLPLLPEDKVLDYVRWHGSITRKQCAELLDLKDIEARRLLHRMRGKGILMQIGYKKGSRYKLPE
ncbi:MAG TPA: ATP-binding protein [Desulfuromonadaceae bacterium]|jgi:ATP-dependent DNA helicase RecG